MLKKGKIFLTPIERHNLVSIHQWLKNLENVLYFSDTFICPPSLDELEIWYNSLINNNKNKVFIINHSENRVPLGMVELSKIDWKNKNAYIGIIIANEKDRRKGYATEALKIIIKLSFEQWNLHKLYSLVIEDNIPSIGLFLKLKFNKEAILKENSFIDNKYRNQVIFSLFKKDYEQNIDFYN